MSGLSFGKIRFRIYSSEFYIVSGTSKGPEFVGDLIICALNPFLYLKSLNWLLKHKVLFPCDNMGLKLSLAILKIEFLTKIWSSS